MARCEEPVSPDTLLAELRKVFAERALNAELGDHRQTAYGDGKPHHP